MAEIPNPFDVAPRIYNEQEKARIFAKVFKDKPFGAPHYLSVTNAEIDAPINAGTVMQMGQYVNPELAMHSDYFKSLNNMMQCVEKNIHLTEAAE